MSQNVFPRLAPGLTVDNRKRDMFSAFAGSEGQGIFDRNKMMRYAEAQRSAVGDKSNQLAPQTPGNLFNNLLGHGRMAPDYPGQPDRSLPTYQNTEEKSNVVVPVVRFFGIPRESDMSELPGHGDVVFLKKSPVRDVVRIGTPAASHINTFLEKEREQAAKRQVFNLNVQPMVAFNPIAFIYRLNEMLIKLAIADPQTYLNTPLSELLRVPGLFDWSGWTLDGVVDFESVGGQSAVSSDGLTSTSVVAGHIGQRNFGLMKQATVTTRGPAKVRDYWRGCGVTEGARLYFCLVKYDLPTNQTKVNYVMSAKSLYQTDTFTSVNSRSLEFPNIPIDTAGTKVPMRPVGLFPLAMPYGDLIDPLASIYLDERGRPQTGLSYEVGLVQFLAPQAQYYPAEQISLDLGKPFLSKEPLTDATLLTTRPLIDVLLPNFKDGPTYN